MNTDARPEKLSQLIAQLNAEGVNDYALKKQEARPVVFHGMGKNRFSAMWKSPCGAFLKYDVRLPIIFANSAENRPKS